MIYSHSVQVVYFGEGDKLIHTFKMGDRKSTKLRDSSFVTIQFRPSCN